VVHAKQIWCVKNRNFLMNIFKYHPRPSQSAAPAPCNFYIMRYEYRTFVLLMIGNLVHPVFRAAVFPRKTLPHCPLPV
jgi:hypothetical protein